MGVNYTGKVNTARATPAVGRFGSPADGAAACVYLVSTEAGFVTGQTLGANGGSVTS